MFVSTANPEKESPLVTVNAILSILAADYLLINYLVMSLTTVGRFLLCGFHFADLWVPFCRKHNIDLRNPESYFSLQRDPCKNKVRSDFVKERRKAQYEYQEFKIWINGLPDSIRKRADHYNNREAIKATKLSREAANDEPMEHLKISKATWMADGTQWPGTWTTSAPEHSRGDHSSIIQVIN